MNVLVVGASGNLGSCFSRRLLSAGHRVRMTYNRTPLPAELAGHPQGETLRVDLDHPASLEDAVQGLDVVVFCAGKLFAPAPQRFLPRTNIEWARSAIETSIAGGVGKLILLSFPHVEEGTTPDRPGTGSLDGEPRAIHARTRLQAEKNLFAASQGTDLVPVVLRLGMVYGQGAKLSEAARRLLRRRLLAVWRQPTWVHLITLEDAARAVQAAVESESCRGIYNVCDEEPLTLQAFLDELADALGYPRPRRLPRWCFWATAWLVDRTARILRLPAPLNLDILRMGMTSAVADTTRFRAELLPELEAPTFREGLAQLRDRAAEPR